MSYVLFNTQVVKREQVTIDIEDRGYQFGDGVYEVVRIYGGRSYLMKEHMIRLERSASEISLTLPTHIEELEGKLEELIQLNEVQDGIIYLQISRGVAPRAHGFPPPETRSSLIAYTKDFPRPLQQMKEGGKAILVEDIRWLRCDIKSLNLLGNVLAKQKAQDLQCLEAIQHRNGTITEGSATNVCIINEGIISTHPATNLILDGITKNKVLELCTELKIPFKEEAFSIEQLMKADEVFITSTTNEITPIILIDGKEIGPGIPGPITVKLQQAFEDDINKG